METGELMQILFLIMLILCSAFFSSAETSYVTVNRIQLQLLADEGNKKAVRALWILDHSAKMLSTILIGNNVVNLSASSLATTLTISLFGNAFVGASTGILTFVVLLFCEITPKTIATVKALRLALAYSAAVKALMTVLAPLVFIVESIRNILLKILRIDPNEKSSMTEDELKTLVDVGYEEGAIESDEFEMISNIFSLDETTAKDIMVPRIDMVFVHVDTSYDDLKKLYQNHPHNRYPVFSESTNHVIGIINIRDLLFFDKGKLFPVNKSFSVRNYLRKPHFTFEHKEVGTLLLEMKEKSINFITVLDEYGATSGLITIEDIIEEIVGEIRDEYNEGKNDSVKILKEGKEFLVDGSTNLDVVNEKTGLSLKSEEYDTLAGYIIEKLDRLPKHGEAIILKNGTKLISVLVSKNRIEKIHIVVP